MFSKFLKKSNKKKNEPALETIEGLKKGRFGILVRVGIGLAILAVLYLFISVAKTATKNIDDRRRAQSMEQDSQVRIEISKEEIWKRRTERDIGDLRKNVQEIGQSVDKKTDEIKKALEDGLDNFGSRIDSIGTSLNEKIEAFKKETGADLNKTREDAEKIAKLQADLSQKALEDRISTLESDQKKSSKTKANQDTTLPPLPKAPGAVTTSDDQIATASTKNDEDDGVSYEAVTVNQVPFASNTHFTSRLDSLTDENTTIKTPNFTMVTSIGQATLINGFAAPTFTKGEKGPVPALLRVDTELVMPNDAVQQTEGCFLLGVASGDISSQRADVRISKIACVFVNSNTDERYVLQEKVEGWVFGDEGAEGRRGDSMYGLSGRLVTRNGTILLRLLMVGFLQGVADSFADQDVLIPSYREDTQGAFQQSLTRGAFSGSNSALERLADYYMKMADETFPVIEVLGGRKVSFMLKGGESLPVTPFDGIDVNYFQDLGDL